MNASIKLTVFFQGPFWVGVFEKTYGENYEVSKVIFGSSEPKDYEIYEFLIKNFYTLRFSASLFSQEIGEIKEKKINPKKLQKEIKKEIENRGIGTKAQLAMKEQYETVKLERKKLSREEKDLEKERKFDLRQQKKLMKHRGH
jgi:Protein of unknown function (DUF2992).